MPKPEDPSWSPTGDSDTVDEILAYLFEIARGECSIDEAQILAATELDPRKAEVLTALLFVHQDLVYKEERHVAVIAALEQEREALVTSQHLAAERASPLIKLSRGVILVPLIGPLGEALASTSTERIMAGIARGEVRHLILDLTGVPSIDASAVESFGRLVHAVELLGVHCIVAGVRASVARSLVRAEFVEVEVVANVERALRIALE